MRVSVAALAGIPLWVDQIDKRSQHQRSRASRQPPARPQSPVPECPHCTDGRSQAGGETPEVCYVGQRRAESARRRAEHNRGPVGQQCPAEREHDLPVHRRDRSRRHRWMPSESSERGKRAASAGAKTNGAFSGQLPSAVFCQCPHRDIVVTGKLVSRYPGRDETYAAGDSPIASASSSHSHEIGTGFRSTVLNDVHVDVGLSLRSDRACGLDGEGSQRSQTDPLCQLLGHRRCGRAQWSAYTSQGK
jgi:hypothetical protein